MARSRSSFGYFLGAGIAPPFRGFDASINPGALHVGSDARFTVEVGVSYLALEHNVPHAGSFGTAFAHRLSWLGDEPRDRWFAFDLNDPGTLDDAGRQLDEAWQTAGRPLAEAMRSPELLCDYVAATGNEVVALTTLELVARPLGDREREAALAKRATNQAANRERWRYLPNDRHPLELGLSYWARIIRHLDRLDGTLNSSHRAAAASVLEDAADGMLSTRFHSAMDEEDAVLLRRHWDARCPPSPQRRHDCRSAAA